MEAWRMSSPHHRCAVDRSAVVRNHCARPSHVHRRV